MTFTWSEYEYDKPTANVMKYDAQQITGLLCFDNVAFVSTGTKFRAKITHTCDDIHKLKRFLHIAKIKITTITLMWNWNKCYLIMKRDT
jgi:hypothetical protein